MRIVPSQMDIFLMWMSINYVPVVPSILVVSDPQVAVPGPIILVGFVKFNSHQITTQFILMLHGFI